MALREFHCDVDLKGRLLLGGSAGTAGQVPISGGAGAPATWGDAGVGGGSVLVDADTAGTIYVGTAPSGSSQSAAVWSITRSTFTAAGIRASKGIATNVTWTGRASHSYT